MHGQTTPNCEYHYSEIVQMIKYDIQIQNIDDDDDDDDNNNDTQFIYWFLFSYPFLILYSLRPDFTITNLNIFLLLSYSFL